MQPKVSIVIPCYNKAPYIHKMLDSVIVQKWDNIELVLVNDGSTDNTRDIILAYEPRLKSRGFEIVLVEQENLGLPGAVYEGLKRTSGEFVCQVDADDELEADYVSTLAGWLSFNPDYAGAVCDFRYVHKDREVHHSYFSSGNQGKYLSHLTESFFLGRVIDMVWVYMMRSKYLKDSGMLDHFYYETRRTQEPQYVLPLAVGGGKIKHFPIPLYRYIQNETQMSIRKSKDDYERYYEQYHQIVDKTVEWLYELHPEMKRLPILAELGRLRRLLFLSERFYQEDSQGLDTLRKETATFINQIFTPSPQVTEGDTVNSRILFAAIIDYFCDNQPFRPSSALIGRVIAWGALGKNGRSILGNLTGTPLEPHEMWDKGGDEVGVKRPDPASLTAHDTVLILPSQFEIANEIQLSLKQSGCTLLTYDHILSYMASHKFPEFYDHSLRLSLGGAESCNPK